MSPSDLPWWAWLLCSIGILVVSSFIYWTISIFTGEDNVSGCIVSIILGLLALFCAIIGVIRFVKWAWYS